MANYYSLYVIV